MATLTPIRVNKVGVPDLIAALVAAGATGDDVQALPGLFIVMHNASAASRTLTVTRPKDSQDCGSLGELPVSDIVFTVEAGKTGVLAIPAGYQENGSFAWDYDDNTDVTIGVFLSNP